MPTIRFPTDGPQYATLRHRGLLDETYFFVVEPTGAIREPRGMATLEDLDHWMIDNGYEIANQRPDYRGRRGHHIHILADVVPAAPSRR